VSVHPLASSRAIDPVAQARTHLAAAHRLAVLHELEEGIDNHFTVTVPGRDDRYLILPFGLHWSEARASDMIVFDESGSTLEGEGILNCRRSASTRLSTASAAYVWCSTHTSPGRSRSTC
jgi:ribulose-5-phosphate 4-epimerase/fuculose-1-phosphate aldolase